MWLSPFQAASLVFLSALCDVELEFPGVGSQAAASLRIDNVSLCAQWHIFATLYLEMHPLSFFNVLTLQLWMCF